MTRHARFAAPLMAAMLLATPALADNERPAMISVSGEATVSVPPDLAEIDGGFTAEGKTAREASDATNTAMGKVLLALKAAGVEEKDIQTSRLSLHPQTQNTPNRAGPPSIVGYRAGNHVTIRLRDVTKVASVIDILVGAGANDIGGINFMVSTASKLLDEAREQAFADARRKAEIYAKAAGVTLGAPLSIAEGSASVPMFRSKMVMAPMVAAAPVAQGEETLSVTVNVSWAIKQEP
jgi:uncharacterized protein